MGPSWLRQLEQYQGAGFLTGLGLRRRHLAQRKRLPFTDVFGRAFLPVLGMLFAIEPLTNLGHHATSSVNAKSASQGLLSYRPHPNLSVTVDLNVDDVGSAADRAVFDILLARPRRQVDR